MAERSIEVILQQGLLGAFCVILIFVTWQLFKLYSEAQEEKLKILREALSATAPLADTIKELTRSHELLADKIQRLEDVSSAKRR
jgi:Tfp pilus assembly protein PilN